MFCTGCGDAEAVIQRRYTSLCQFCFDRLRHELMIRTRAIREHGRYARDNRTGNFGVTFARADGRTLSMCLYISTTPAEAYAEARRIAALEGMRLLRIDIQRSLTDIYRSPDYGKYLQTGEPPLEYDEGRYGPSPLFPGLHSTFPSAAA